MQTRRFWHKILNLQEEILSWSEFESHSRETAVIFPTERHKEDSKRSGEGPNFMKKLKELWTQKQAAIMKTEVLW